MPPTDDDAPTPPRGLKDDELAWLLLALLDTAPKGMTAEELAEAVQKFTQSAH